MMEAVVLGPLSYMRPLTIDLFEENFPPLNFRVKERMVAFQTSKMSPCLNLKSIIKILNFFFFFSHITSTGTVLNPFIHHLQEQVWEAKS